MRRTTMISSSRDWDWVREFCYLNYVRVTSVSPWEDIGISRSSSDLLQVGCFRSKVKPTDLPTTLLTFLLRIAQTYSGFRVMQYAPSLPGAFVRSIRPLISSSLNARCIVHDETPSSRASFFLERCNSP